MGSIHPRNAELHGNAAVEGGIHRRVDAERRKVTFSGFGRVMSHRWTLVRVMDRYAPNCNFPAGLPMTLLLFSAALEDFIRHPSSYTGRAIFNPGPMESSALTLALDVFRAGWELNGFTNTAHTRTCVYMV